MFPREHQVIGNQVKQLMELLPTINSIQQQIPDKATQLDFLADTILLCRKSEEILQALHKSLNTLSDKAEEQVCITLAALNNGSKFSGENATITPKPEFYIEFPSKPDDPNYIEFVKQLTPEMVRPHYPTISEYILTEVEKGNQLPFGLKDIAGSKSKVICRGKREL